jgi:NADPH:quinone reductase-like Zn-dependent oxidoreductase
VKAIVMERYGIENLELREIERPALAPDRVLVRVQASSVNPVEWYGVSAPFFVRIAGGALRRPKETSVGSDLAGVVEAIGSDVTRFKPGDEVFGVSGGSWAEYTAAREDRLALKPKSASFDEAAVVPVAGLTALQAVRDHGRVQPGQKVLINGAAGGVGTFALQIAKVYGAEVTAVCSTANVEQARSLGADHVVDYTHDDFTRLGERFDVMLDIAGSRSLGPCRRVLARDATVVAVGGKMTKGLGPLRHLAAMRLGAIGRSQQVVNFIAKTTPEELGGIAELMDTGQVRSVIDRQYALADVADGLRYLGTQHARGKLLVTI